MPLAQKLPEKFHSRLLRSYEWSRAQQRPFLETGMDVLQQLVGKHYGRNSCRYPVPQNFVRLLNTIIVRYLSSRNPRAMIEANDPRLRAVARSGQMWANERLRVSNLEKVLQRWVADAVTYNIGAIKICAQEGYDGEMEEPYIDTVSRDRFCWDFQATHWTQVGWLSHEYDVVIDDLRGDGFDEDFVRTLTPNSTDSDEYEATESLSRDTGMMEETLHDKVKCVEFYLPREGLLVSYPRAGTSINPKPVRTTPYIGLAGRENPLGPFEILCFDEVPGNLMPTPPIHAIYDMHLAANRIARKLLMQAQNQKTITMVLQAMRQDADEMAKVKDGGFLPVANMDGFQPYRSAGPDAATWGFGQYLEREINKHGGNMDVAAGLGIAAPTARQEELIDANSSRMIQFLQAEMRSATARLMRKMFWYPWHSNRELQYTENVQGTGIAVPANILPEERRGSYELMSVTVHPYSLSPVTPEARLAQMTQLFQEMLSVAPLLVQQGYSPNFIAYFRKKAEFLDLPFLDELLAFTPVSPEQAAMGSQLTPDIQQPQRPGVGQYTRTNVGSEEGQNQDIMRMMRSPDGGGEAA